MKNIILLIVLSTFIACSQDKKQKADSSDGEYSLVPTKEYTNFEIDADTKLYTYSGVNGPLGAEWNVPLIEAVIASSKVSLFF